MAPCIYLVHRRADIYPDPHAFRPERFARAVRRHLHAGSRSAAATRRCLGASFATFELKAVLSAIVSRVDLRTADPRPERPVRRAITIVPSNGAEVITEPLQGVRPAAAEWPRGLSRPQRTLGPAARRGGRRDRAGRHQQVELRAHASSAQAPAHTVAPDGQHAARPSAPGHAHPAALRALAEAANASRSR